MRELVGEKMGGNVRVQDQSKEIKIDRCAGQEKVTAPFHFCLGVEGLTGGLGSSLAFSTAGISCVPFTSVVNGTLYVPVTFRVILVPRVTLLCSSHLH